MNELIGALGIPGAIAALIVALERGIAVGKQLRNGKGGHHGNGNGVELQKEVARISAQLETIDRDLLGVRDDFKKVPDQIGRAVSTVVARCEEIIDPIRRQADRLEERFDKHLGGVE